MGWASGSSLMSEVIASLKGTVSDDKIRVQAYVGIIEAFEGNDCDTLDECIGDDEAWDTAYGIVNPVFAGQMAAERGEPRDSNPFIGKRRATDRRRWDEGWALHHGDD